MGATVFDAMQSLQGQSTLMRSAWSIAPGKIDTDEVSTVESLADHGLAAI